MFLPFVTFPSDEHLRRVWRYQQINQNTYIKEEQTKQWPKEKVQKDKQWSTKHTHKTKDWVTQTPLKTRGELRCPGRVQSNWDKNRGGGELRCPGRVQPNWEKFDDTKWVIKIRCIKSYPSIHRPITTYCESHHLTVCLHSTALYCCIH